MAGVISGIICIPLVCLAVYILIFTVVSDIKYERSFRGAPEAWVIVEEVMPDVRRSGYGRGSSRRYGRFRAHLGGQPVEVVYDPKKMDVREGMSVPVRYRLSDDGIYEPYDPSYGARVRAFGISLPLGILWGLALAYAKMHGWLD